MLTWTDVSKQVCHAKWLSTADAAGITAARNIQKHPETMRFNYHQKSGFPRFPVKIFLNPIQ
jgi:hypothetical protein